MTYQNALEMDLFVKREPPCLSLFQPTHRHHPDNRGDPTRFKNLVKSLEASLRRRRDCDDIGALLEPFRALGEDPSFWRHTLDGLAVLAAPGWFRFYRLQRTVPELAIVADSFHVKPLLRILQSADRYQILALSRDRIRLLEGNRDVLDEAELAPDVPKSLTAALGEELTEPRLTVSSYGKGAEGPAMYHGHGGRKDQLELDTERFFRSVDRAIFERHSKPSGLPLLLAGLAENQSIFRGVSHNTFLMDEGVEVNPEAKTLEELRLAAWRAVEPHYLAKLAALVGKFEAANGTGLAGDDPAAVAEAAVAGRVETLLVDAERRLPGTIDRATGAVSAKEIEEPDVDDVLDDLAELVLQTGGHVVVVPSERMPSETGLAAVYRY